MSLTGSLGFSNILSTLSDVSGVSASLSAWSLMLLAILSCVVRLSRQWISKDVRIVMRTGFTKWLQEEFVYLEFAYASHSTHLSPKYSVFALVHCDPFHYLEWKGLSCGSELALQ